MIDKVKDEENLDENQEQLDEFKADHSDSAIADPVDTGSSARPADKQNGDTAPQSIDTDGVTVRSREGLIGRTISDLKDAPEELVKSIYDTVRDWKSNGPDKNARPADKMANGDKATKKLSREAVEQIFGEDAEEELSEEFLDRAATIFETAVFVRVEELRGEIAEEYENKLNEAKEENLNTVAEQVGDFLDTVSNIWLEQNEVAIESNIKVELAEDLFKGFRTMCEAYNIDLPDEKVDVVESIEKDLEKVETSLAEANEKNAELELEIKELRSKAIFDEITEGLATTEQEKISTLTEGLAFNDLDEYREKLTQIKETYVKSSKVITEENADEGSEDGVHTGLEDGDEEGDKKDVAPSMQRYVQGINRTLGVR